jgi:hypothetical protein
VNLAEKIQVKVYANQDKSLADLKMLATLMISIVFCSLIIHESDEFVYFQFIKYYVLINIVLRYEHKL